MSNRLERMKEFYKTLDCSIDLAYFADEDHESFDDLRQAIEDGDGCNVEIIYYSEAIEYLQRQDPSLREALEICAELGYSLSGLSSEVLASALASRRAEEEFADLEGEIEDFFLEVEEEEGEEEEEDEDEKEEEK